MQLCTCVCECVHCNSPEKWVLVRVKEALFETWMFSIPLNFQLITSFRVIAELLLLFSFNVSHCYSKTKLTPNTHNVDPVMGWSIREHQVQADMGLTQFSAVNSNTILTRGS